MRASIKLRVFPLICLAAAAAHAISLPGASSPERSLSIGYGPSSQFHVGFDRGPWGAYAYPFARIFEGEYNRVHEYSIRVGNRYSYPAFTYRQMECRGQLGAGFHGGWQNWQYTYAPDNNLYQYGFDISLQPEFRFYQRFALLLEAAVFNYTWQNEPNGRESHSDEFESRDFSLSELKLGLRYYFQFRKTTGPP